MLGVVILDVVINHLRRRRCRRPGNQRIKISVKLESKRASSPRCPVSFEEESCRRRCRRTAFQSVQVGSLRSSSVSCERHGPVCHGRHGDVMSSQNLAQVCGRTALLLSPPSGGQQGGPAPAWNMPSHTSKACGVSPPHSRGQIWCNGHNRVAGSLLRRRARAVIGFADQHDPTVIALQNRTTRISDRGIQKHSDRRRHQSHGPFQQTRGRHRTGSCPRFPSSRGRWEGVFAMDPTQPCHRTGVSGAWGGVQLSCRKQGFHVS